MGEEWVAEDDVWTRLVRLVGHMGDSPVEGHTRWQCDLCMFVADHEKGFTQSQVNSHVIQHARAVHRDAYLNMVDMAYGELHRGQPAYPAYTPSLDSDTLYMLASEVEGKNGDRKTVCVICGYTLMYRGRRDPVDAHVDAMMHAHMAACHDMELMQARALNMEYRGSR